MDILRPEDLDLSSVARSPFGHLKADSLENLLQRAAWAYREALAENQGLARTVEELTERVEELTMQVASLEETTARHKEPDGLARSLLASAQRAARDEREAARREAELILKEAARRAGELEQEVSRREADHGSELARLEALRDDILVRLRGTLETIVEYHEGRNDAQELAALPESPVRQDDDQGQQRDTSSEGIGDAREVGPRGTRQRPGVDDGESAELEAVAPAERDRAGGDDIAHSENQPHRPEQKRGHRDRVPVARSWGKWAAAVAVIVVTAVLVFVADRPRHHPSAALGALGQTGVSAVTTPAQTERARPGTSTESTVARTRAQPHVTTRSTGRVVLTLRAVDTTWVEVRNISSTGPLLYSGLLSPGARRSFRASWRLWVRFGGAANLAVTLDGRQLRVPTGTYDAFFDAHGFRQVVG
jgi:cell division septum initiation protein DivIVA